MNGEGASWHAKNTHINLVITLTSTKGKNKILFSDFNIKNVIYLMIENDNLKYAFLYDYLWQWLAALLQLFLSNLRHLKKFLKICTAMLQSGISSLLSASRIHWILIKLQDIVNNVPMVWFNRPQRYFVWGKVRCFDAAAPIWHPKHCANGEKWIPKTETLILHVQPFILNLKKEIFAT